MSDDTASQETAKRRKTLIGTVRSTKMDKTVTVDINRLVRHEKYQKFIRRRSTFYAHDEKEIAKEGDQVRIMETRPLSKKKRWRVIEIVQAAKVATTAGEGGDA